MSVKFPINILSVFLGLWSLSAIANEPVLNSDEQDYLNQHTTFTLCVDPDWLPYEKLNAEGKHIGLVAQYMALIQSRLMIIFKPILTKSWEETQKYYREGRCDIVSALNKTSEREQYLDFSQPYLKSPAVLVLNEKNQKDRQLSDLKNKTLGMVKGYVYDLKLREQYPEIKIIYLPNMDTALQKVASGEIDATIGPMLLFFTLVQELGLNNLTIMGNVEYQDELRLGIKKDNKILVDILDKAVLSISAEDNAAIKKNWAKMRKVQK